MGTKGPIHQARTLSCLERKLSHTPSGSEVTEYSETRERDYQS
jgi:hypothetical protein